jgi:hypothetical protein
LQHHESGLAAESRLGLAQVKMAKNDSSALVDTQAASDQFRQEREKDQDAKSTTLLLQISCAK